MTRDFKFLVYQWTFKRVVIEKRYKLLCIPFECALVKNLNPLLCHEQYAVVVKIVGRYKFPRLMSVVHQLERYKIPTVWLCVHRNRQWEVTENGIIFEIKMT